jgi:hypothetical protein
MKRTFAALSALMAAMAVAACDDPQPDQTDMAEMPAEAPDAMAADDAGVEAAAPSATDTPPAVDPGALPADKRSSEESVKPESETLFY